MKKKLRNILLSVIGLVMLLSLIGVISGTTQKIHVETEINAPADKAWEILGHQFAEIDKWSSTVETSRVAKLDEIPDEITVSPNAPVPGRVTVSRVLEATEILVDYSDEKRAFLFLAIDLPKFAVTYTGNNSRIVEKGPNKSIVVFDAELRFTPPFFFMKYIMKSRLTTMFGILQGELKTYAETGEIATTNSN